jgi:hypothetical protein
LSIWREAVGEVDSGPPAALKKEKPNVSETGL